MIESTFVVTLKERGHYFDCKVVLSKGTGKSPRPTIKEAPELRG